MSFAKTIFALMFCMFGILVGITEIYNLIIPVQTQMTGNSNIQSSWLVHAAYSLCAISCLGSSFLLNKNMANPKFKLK